MPPPPQPSSPRPLAPPSAPLSGLWVLENSPSRSPSAPESVTVSLTEANGTVSGSLDALYKGRAGRKLLSFSGRFQGASMRLVWASPATGERGQIEFIRVAGAPNRLEVVWYSNTSTDVYNHLLRRLD